MFIYYIFHRQLTHKKKRIIIIKSIKLKRAQNKKYMLFNSADFLKCCVTVILNKRKQINLTPLIQ